jgi:hypothetical protein
LETELDEAAAAAATDMISEEFTALLSDCGEGEGEIHTLLESGGNMSSSSSACSVKIVTTGVAEVGSEGEGSGEGEWLLSVNCKEGRKNTMTTTS